MRRHRQAHRVVTPAAAGSSPAAPAICGSSSVGRASACHAGCRGFESRLPLHFLFQAIITNVETVAELMILAMSMFLAAFFCMKVLFIPDSAIKTLDKIYEVEKEIYQER